MLYSNHSSLDSCSPHAAAASFQDLSRRNNCGFWHTLLTWSIVVNALHAGGSYTGMRGIHTCHSACYFRLGPCCCLCGARGDSVQTGSHLSCRILQTGDPYVHTRSSQQTWGASKPKIETSPTVLTTCQIYDSKICVRHATLEV